MRVLLVVCGLALAALPTVAADHRYDCSRGPHETVLPANVDCCGISDGGFCFFHCDVWASNPAPVGPTSASISSP